MPTGTDTTDTPRVIDRKDFDELLQAIKKRYPRLLGPTVSEGSLIYDRIESASDLPAGYTDRQEAGHYRLVKSRLPALFRYVVGQQSWKKFFHVAEEVLWRAERKGKSFEILEAESESQPTALMGVRACELSALKIQDRILSRGPYADVNYKRRREGAFVVAVNCVRPGGTCFCASMESGPVAKEGFDLALTEVCNDKEHWFLVRTGGRKGTEVLSETPARPAQPDQIEAAEELERAAAGKMGRELDTDGIVEMLASRFDSPHWGEVAERCLSCSNCALVCPTCFCSDIQDFTDLSGEHVERRRQWDTCYSIRFSYIHGGSVRTSGEARYRQWLTHKLGNWIDQFGMSGCVGCGRCITWCPAAIDITEEVRALRAGAEGARAE